MKRKGLTLMELLIVIGIIAGLGLLVMGIVSEIRWRTDIHRCISNLRQIGLALRLYAQDWHGFAPPYSCEPPYPSERKDLPALLVSAFKPYIKDDSVWLCPRDSGPKPRWDFTSYTIPPRYGYMPIRVDAPPIMVPADIRDPRKWAREGEPFFDPDKEFWEEWKRHSKCAICLGGWRDFRRWVYTECEFHERRPGDSFYIFLFLSGNVRALQMPQGILHGCPAKQLPDDWPLDDLPR